MSEEEKPNVPLSLVNMSTAQLGLFLVLIDMLSEKGILDKSEYLDRVSRVAHDAGRSTGLNKDVGVILSGLLEVLRK